MIREWCDFSDLESEQYSAYEEIRKYCLVNKFGVPDKTSVTADLLYLSWVLKRTDGSQTTRISISKDGRVVFKNILELDHGFHTQSHFDNFNLSLRTRFSHD